MIKNNKRAQNLFFEPFVVNIKGQATSQSLEQPSSDWEVACPSLIFIVR